MCGIVGIVSKESRPQQIVNMQSMMTSLAHRGPDEHGKYLDQNVALGHQRLSILDVEQGTQPFSSDDQTLIMIYNGECHNYQVLRKDLETKGYVFATSSDTEVVLKLYEAYKEKAF